MENIQQNDVRGILNETSMKIHKQEIGAADFHTVCGQVYHTGHGQLQMVQIDQAKEKSSADTCGRCFEESRRY